MDKEEFLEELFKSAEEELKDVDQEREENKNELLQEIAMILLTYTIIDSILSLTGKQKKALYKRLSSTVLSIFGSQSKKSLNKVTSILNRSANKILKSYGLKFTRDDVLKIINNNFKGKHFSKRIWKNENEVSKMLHKEIKDFLDGKVNVNQIKAHIQNHFETDKYNIKRLVDTEISRIEGEVTEKYLKDYGIKKVKYNACLCNTCDKCLSDHEKIFKVDDTDRPSLPRHPQCKCFYVQEDKGNKKILDN